MKIIELLPRKTYPFSCYNFIALVSTTHLSIIIPSLTSKILCSPTNKNGDNAVVYACPVVIKIRTILQTNTSVRTRGVHITV